VREANRIQWPRPFEGLRGIKRADLPREISAGITLAALVIPLKIGYAQVAGLPATIGLYAAIIPLVMFAVFTSSRHLVEQSLTCSGARPTLSPRCCTKPIQVAISSPAAEVPLFQCRD